MRTWALLAGVVVGTMACGPKETVESDEPHRFESTGTVISVEDGFVLIDHQDIPGFMDAMTMSFPVTDPALLTGISAGDRVRFRVAVDGASYRIDDIEIEGE